MPLQDSFNLEKEEKEKETLEEKFSKERKDWLDKIQEMSRRLKTIEGVADLQIDIYTERERCSDYYSYLLEKVQLLSREYRKKYAERYDFWSFKSQIRYPNNNALNNKILVEIEDIVKTRELVENHAKFIAETRSTIDNMIFGISKRVEIEQIKRGK